MAKKNTGSNYHIGVFANMREIYLRNNKPTLYKRLRESGELVKHLKAFQNHHAAIAQEMHQRLAEERGVDQRMFSLNFTDWVIETVKIQEEVRAYMIQLINNDM